MKDLDKQVGNQLEKYMHNFFGYGNWKSKIWFIGIEEGGGKNIKEVEKRINSWSSLGRSELLDNRKHHENIGLGGMFGEHPKLQPTWVGLIRFKYRYLNGGCPNGTWTEIPQDEIRKIQGLEWGLPDGDHVLTEIFPLASPRAHIWKYNEWSNLPALQDRITYETRIINKRIRALQEKIEQEKPEVVLMYWAKFDYWNKLCNVDFRNTKNGPVKCLKICKNYYRYYKQDKTLFIQAPQPTGVRHSRNEFWERLGCEIRNIKAEGS